MDELLYLQLHGVDVDDPVTGLRETIKVQLTFPVSDFPGMRALLGKHIKLHPSRHACPRTWHSGTHVHQVKCFYHNHSK